MKLNMPYILRVGSSPLGQREQKTISANSALVNILFREAHSLAKRESVSMEICVQTFTSTFLLLSTILCCLSDAAPDKPPILFLRSYVNYAWGFVHNGWLIDSSGAIRSFNFLYSSDSMEYSTELMPPSIYKRLLPKSILTGKKVSLDTLNSMQALIDSANRGIITYTPLCADAGKFHYSAFIYDSLNSNYKEILCYQAGDMTACNSASAAKKIARWLISLDSLPGGFCQPPDSCLNPPSVTLRPPSSFITKVHSPFSGLFYLNGKISRNPSRQIMVRKNGKAPLDLEKPTH
jgi:hypothetical protein